MKKLKKIFENSLIKEFSFFSLSTFFFQFSRVTVELAAAKILGPTLWGIWYFLNLVIAYRGVVHLGITNGMNREVPITLGSDQKKHAQELENITFSSVLASTLIASIGILLIANFFEDQILRNALYWLVPLFIVNQFYYQINASLKANSLFNYVSKKQLIFSILFPIIALPLTYFFKLKGFISGFSIALFIAAIVVYKLSPISYDFNFHWSKIKALVKIGFPIMAVGIAYTFLNTVDRWVIGIFLGAKELGYYSMAIIVFGGMTLFPKVITQQIYPRMAFDWGKSKSKADLKRWSRLQTKYTWYLVIPLLIAILIFFPWLIRTWLPEYKPGILAIQIIVFGPLFIPFSAGWGSVLNIIDKQVYYLITIIVAVVLNLVINYFLVLNGFGIAGVAFGTAFTFALYSISIMFMGKYFIERI